MSTNVNKFKVYTVQIVGESSNYVHWSEGLNLYIEKDGVRIKLNQEEIQQLVKALPKTIGGTL